MAELKKPCDHIIGLEEDDDHPFLAFAFCPICGERVAPDEDCAFKR